MLISTASVNEADDEDTRLLECLRSLEPSLKAAWNEKYELYNEELTASLRERDED